MFAVIVRTVFLLLFDLCLMIKVAVHHGDCNECVETLGAVFAYIGCAYLLVHDFLVIRSSAAFCTVNVVSSVATSWITRTKDPSIYDFRSKYQRCRNVEPKYLKSTYELTRLISLFYVLVLICYPLHDAPIETMLTFPCNPALPYADI